MFDMFRILLADTTDMSSNFADMITQILNFMWTRVLFVLFPTQKQTVDQDKTKIEFYEQKMNQAKDYQAWSEAASALDLIEGSKHWIETHESNEYDYELLQSRIDEIKAIRNSGQGRKAMTFALRLSSSRNLGDMGNAALYTHTRIGTKKLISDYIDHVIDQIDWLGDTADSGTDMSLKERHDYFMSLRQSYGRTALLLSGGGTLGFFHLGVLRTLVNARLLPRVISGASTGSVMASLICTLNEQDRIELLNSPPSWIPRAVFESADAPETRLLRLNRYLTKGSFYDPSILKGILKAQLGDITFQEAYNRSRLILNITVSSSSLYEMPRLFNYITSPDVVIWSAVIASCAVPVIYPEDNIYMKDKNGNLMPWTSTDDKYRDGSIDNDLPLQRISELFSVNHFIVVQLNPHVAPFLHKSNKKPTLLRTCTNFVLRLLKEEVQHRCSQLRHVGVSSPFILRLENVLAQRYLGDITIAPELSWTDVSNILTNLDLEATTNFIERGERATWNKLSKIHNSLKIELAIDAAIYKLRKVLLGESPQLPNEMMASDCPPLFMATSPLLLTPSCSSSNLSKTSQSQSPSLDGEDESIDDDEEDSLGPYHFDEDNMATLPTPLWQTEYFTNNSILLMNSQQDTMKRSMTLPSKTSLLPHDISRQGSNVSIRDISPSTSMARFERRKQITSAQFFIAPEFDWAPKTHTTNNNHRKSSIKEKIGVKETMATSNHQDVASISRSEDTGSGSKLKAKALGVKKPTPKEVSANRRKNLSVFIPNRQKKQ